MLVGAILASQPQMNASQLSLKCSRIVLCMQYITTEDAESLEISRRHAGAGPETEIRLGGALVW